MVWFSVCRPCPIMCHVTIQKLGRFCGLIITDKMASEITSWGQFHQLFHAYTDPSRLALNFYAAKKAFQKLGLERKSWA